MLLEQTKRVLKGINLADLVLWVHLQFANLLEKQTSKNIFSYKSR